MTNSFPYWQFHNDRWLTGKVSSFDLDQQGLFLHFCMSAWSGHGAFEISPMSIRMRFKKSEEWISETVAAMEDLRIIVSDGDRWHIKFVDAQLAAMMETREKKSTAGRASWKAREEEDEEEVTKQKVTKQACSTGVEQVLNGCLTGVEQMHENEGLGIDKKPSFAYSPDFEAFWKAYPRIRRTGKMAACRKWNALKKSGVLPPLEKIMKAVDAQTYSTAWRKDNGAYVPAPEVWLNKGRWDDYEEANER